MVLNDYNKDLLIFKRKLTHIMDINIFERPEFLNDKTYILENPFKNIRNKELQENILQTIYSIGNDHGLIMILAFGLDGFKQHTSQQIMSITNIRLGRLDDAIKYALGQLNARLEYKD